jgi:hypothetical protein
MFKKKLAMLIAAALMTLSASSAFAAFGDMELIRVYYDRAGAEYATDLGNINTLLAAPSTTIAGSFSGANGTATLAAYFALDRATNQLWATNADVTTAAFTPAVIGGGTGLTSIKSGTTFMYNTYNAAATIGGTEYSGLASNANSYKNKISATQGWFGNTITAANSARTFSELNLTTLATNNTQTLYHWTNAASTIAADKIGVAAAQIITNADGSTTITTTPIPPAFFLMGSGLLGMFGLRRKNKVA